MASSLNEGEPEGDVEADDRSESPLKTVLDTLLLKREVIILPDGKNSTNFLTDGGYARFQELSTDDKNMFRDYLRILEDHLDFSIPDAIACVYCNRDGKNRTCTEYQYGGYDDYCDEQYRVNVDVKKKVFSELRACYLKMQSLLEDATTKPEMLKLVK